MEKHPIDELFVSNLREHSTVPSPRAAELFQKRLAEQKRSKKIIFASPTKKYYWAAAACVLLAVTVGGWLTFQPNNVRTISQRTSPISEPELVSADKSADNPQFNKTSLSPSFSNNTIKPLPKPQVAKNTEESYAANRLSKKKSVKTDLNKVEQKLAVPSVVLDEPILDKLTLAVLDAEREKKKEAAKLRRMQQNENSVFKNSVAETVIVISEVQPDEEQVLIPEISGDSPVSIARATQIGRERQLADRSLLAKIFTEIKNLKHGEKLDVAGLNETTSQVFARADDGFLANEKEEMNYRFNRLKEVFSKDEVK